MCGICGVYNLNGEPAERAAVLRMRARLIHRGPDDEGEHFDGPVGLGFRRLSILDLAGGHQPMSTEDGRLTIVFNGEIYNHPQLRASLESSGVRFKTRSDTETILELYAREGSAAFGRLNGMFAVAIWDKVRREFILARDPIGIKPLYYHFDGEGLIFSSELRSLLACGLLDDALDSAGVLDYLSYGKVHSPRTVFRDALKLPPAHLLRLNAEGLRLENFWRLPHHRKKAAPVDTREAMTRLDGLLSDAVRGNMLSDVPVGAFLSGGVDSSLVTAYMVSHAGSRKVPTFSVGFEGAPGGVDESVHAREVARHLGTEHHEIRLKADVLSRLEESIEFLDEPLADSAILPTFLLSKFARQSVKVVLTGEGADELFAGYDRHKAAWVNQGLKKLPAWGRRLAAPLARRLGKGALFERLPFDDARQWARASAPSSAEDFNHFLHPDFLESSRHSDPLEWLKDFSEMDHLNDALAFDFKTILADSLLMKVDKSSMRASLEARVPFLDKHVVEYAAGLPSSFKIRHFKGKYLLRQLAEKYLPKKIAWRRKHGFIVPWEPWVRASGNALIGELLSDSGFKARGIFDMDRLRFFREEMIRGSRDVDAGLFFRIIILGLWLESMTRERLAAR